MGGVCHELNLPLKNLQKFLSLRIFYLLFRPGRSMILFEESSECSRGSAAYSRSYGGLLFTFRWKKRCIWYRQWHLAIVVADWPNQSALPPVVKLKVVSRASERSPEEGGGSGSAPHSTWSTQPQSLPELTLESLTYRHSNVWEPEPSVYVICCQSTEPLIESCSEPSM